MRASAVSKAPEVDCWLSITIGGTSAPDLLGGLTSNILHPSPLHVDETAREMILGSGFTTSQETRTICLARSTVRRLGFSAAPTTAELWRRIEEVGKLCPAEVGPHLRTCLRNQSLGDHFGVAMSQITTRIGNPSVFFLGRNTSTRWLSGWWIEDIHRWQPSDEIVFALNERAEP